MNDEQTESVVRALETMARNVQMLNDSVTRFLELLETKLEEEDEQA